MVEQTEMTPQFNNEILDVLRKFGFVSDIAESYLNNETIEKYKKDIGFKEELPPSASLIIEILIFFQGAITINSTLSLWKRLSRFSDVIIGFSVINLTLLTAVITAIIRDKLFPPINSEDGFIYFLINNHSSFIDNIPDNLTLSYFKELPIPGPRQLNDQEINRIIGNKSTSRVQSNVEVDDESSFDPKLLEEYKQRLALIVKIISVPPSDIPDSIEQYMEINVGRTTNIVDLLYAINLTGMNYYKPLLAILGDASLQSIKYSRYGLFVAQSFLTLKLSNQALWDAREKTKDLIVGAFNPSPIDAETFYSLAFQGNVEQSIPGINYALAQSKFLRQTLHERLARFVSKDPNVLNLIYQIFEIMASLRHWAKFPIFGSHESLMFDVVIDGKAFKGSIIVNILTMLIKILSEEDEKKIREEVVITAQLIMSLHLRLNTLNQPGRIVFTPKTSISIESELTRLVKAVKTMPAINEAEVMDRELEDSAEEEQAENEIDENPVEEVQEIPQTIEERKNATHGVIILEPTIESLAKLMPLDSTQSLTKIRKYPYVFDSKEVPPGKVIELSGSDFSKEITREELEQRIRQGYLLIERAKEELSQKNIRQVIIGVKVGDNLYAPQNVRLRSPAEPGSIRELSPWHLGNAIKYKLNTILRNFETFTAPPNPLKIDDTYIINNYPQLLPDHVRAADFNVIKVLGRNFTGIISWSIPISYDFSNPKKPIMIFLGYMTTVPVHVSYSLRSIKDIRSQFKHKHVSKKGSTPNTTVSDRDYMTFNYRSFFKQNAINPAYATMIIDDGQLNKELGYRKSDTNYGDRIAAPEEKGMIEEYFYEQDSAEPSES
jgi:hypothetical protein